jgi:hypothetical protein
MKRALSRYVLSYLKIQCALMTISLPILAYSSLAISAMTLVGNFIFAPLFSAFLILCSIIFFCKCFVLPSTPFITLLEYVSRAISYLLNLGSKKWLLATPAPHGITVLACIGISLYVLSHRCLKTPLRSISASLLLSSLMCILFYAAPPRHENPLLHKLTALSISGPPDALVIEDKGEFARHANIDNFITYDLCGALREEHGIITINTLRLLRPNYRALRATLGLLSFFPITTIEIASRDFNSPSYLKRYLAQLYSESKRYNTRLKWLAKAA